MLFLLLKMARKHVWLLFLASYNLVNNVATRAVERGTVNCKLPYSELYFHIGQCKAVQCFTVYISIVQCIVVQGSELYFSVVLCRAVRCSAVQCSAVKGGAVQCSNGWCSAVL